MTSLLGKRSSKTALGEPMSLKARLKDIDDLSRSQNFTEVRDKDNVVNVRDLDRACGDLKSNDTQGYAFEGGKLYWVFLIDFGATVSRKFTSSLPPTTRYVDNPAVASESSTTASSLYNHVDDLKRNLEETRQKMEDLSQSMRCGIKRRTRRFKS